MHKRRRRGFRLLLHPVGHRCAPRPCIKPNLSHGLKRVALGRVEAHTGVFLRGVAGHHPAPGPQYPPRRKYARGGLWWGHMGVFAGRRTPCRDPAAPLVLMGSWIHTPPCRVPPMRRPRCPSIECGGERRADARARPPYAPIRRVRLLAGPFAAEWRAHGPKGANGRAAGGPPANRERWEAWQTIAKAGSRPRDAGGGAHALSLAFDSAEYALSALRGLSCIASGLAVTELSGHVYSGDAWGLVADITDAAADALGREFYGGA